MDTKHIVEYLFLTGPFWLTAIPLLGLFIWLIVRTKTSLKVIALLLIIIGGMYLGYSIGQKVAENNLHFKYLLRFQKIFWELSSLANRQEYRDLTIKLEYIKREFPQALKDEQKLLQLFNYLLEPINNAPPQKEAS